MSCFHVIIPARYASTRFPGKLLQELAGKTIIQRAYEQACLSKAASIWIATDDERIYQHVQGFTANVMMTATAHVNGTERLAEAARLKQFVDDDIIVNVQGDEPLIPPQLINQVAENASKHPAAQMATLCCAVSDDKELFNPSMAKVVFDKNGYALCFSRANIPWERDHLAQHPHTSSGEVQHYRHIGIYAYRAGFLQEYIKLAVSPLEQAEQLEQMRILWHGYKVHIGITEQAPPRGVDWPDDLLALEQQLKL